MRFELVMDPPVIHIINYFAIATYIIKNNMTFQMQDQRNTT